MADNNPYGLMGGINAQTPYSPTLGNGSLFVPPAYNNMPTGFYGNIIEQMQDASRIQGQGAGLFTNNASPMLQGIAHSQPSVGGGLLGATAYQGNNPWTGFNPYAGRGNGPGPAGPGAGPGPAAPVFNPPDRPYTGAPTPPVTSHAGQGVPAPFQAPNARAPLPPPQAPQGPAPTQAAGLLGPTPRAADAAAMTTAPAAPAAPGQNQDMNSYVSTFMSLPPEQRGNYFNAISQYGLKQGQNLGAQLDVALRGQMGDDQFKNWLAGMDNQQGSGFNGTAGIPDWLVKGLS